MVGTHEARATVRIGKEWWDYLGGPNCLIELCISLIRACVVPGSEDSTAINYTIADLRQIIAMPPLAGVVNPSLLQQSQLPWLFFLMRHFCDDLIN
jgi:hypothetical protein